MISEADYNAAIAAKNAAEDTINQYHSEKQAAFDERLRLSPIFTDEELIYSAQVLCPCGYGLAYPKGCGAFHYWDCSGILKGIADTTVEHCGQYPFAMSNIKSELQPSAGGRTTRCVFQPKSSAA